MFHILRELFGNLKNQCSYRTCVVYSLIYFQYKCNSNEDFGKYVYLVIGCFEYTAKKCAIFFYRNGASQDKNVGDNYSTSVRKKFGKNHFIAELLGLVTVRSFS